MLSGIYELPVAVIVIGSGLLACFFGNRLFRLVISVYGFIFGVYLTDLVFEVTETTWIIITSILGGLSGALIFWSVYLFVVALVGAGLSVLITDFVFRYFEYELKLGIVVVVAIFGAYISFRLQRMAVILGTAFGGAWTVLVGISLLGFIPDMTLSSNQFFDNFSVGLEFAPEWVKGFWLILSALGALLQIRMSKSIW